MDENNSRTVFITGGTSGIGLGLMNRYLHEGYRVGICSFEKKESIQSRLPTEVTYYEADVTDTARMDEVIKDFSSRSKRLDIVIANAGINHPKTRLPDFVHGTKVISVNVNGVLNTFGPAIEIMRAQGYGQLAAMSSIAGTIGGLPGMAIYCASKSAVLSLCESLAIDLNGYGITVTTLAPGFIDTPLTQKNTHAMPFRMTADDAVGRIYNAIHLKKGLYLFPFPLNWVARIMRLVPRSLYKALMQKDLLKTGKHD